jgi:quinol monooxygenase YgiN
MPILTAKRSQPFLIISGQIAAHKKIEFEHTFRIGFSSLSSECISKNMSEDRNKEGIYYFFSLWPDNDSLNHFMDSQEFQLLNGAFRALGCATRTINGNLDLTEPNMYTSLS